MTDDERDLLATAYLDGDADEDARTRVEGDAELLAAVAAQRAVRAALAQRPPIDPATRERHLAAALGAFDEAAAAPARPTSLVVPPPPPTATVVTPLAPRRRAWLMPVAAAAVGVLALGGVVAMLATGDDDASTARVDVESSVLARTATAREDEAGPPTVDVVAGAAPDAAPAAEAPSDAAAEAESVPVPTIATPAALTAYVAERQAADGDAGPETVCDRPIYGTVVYRTDARAVTVVVVPDTDGEVVALDAATCVEVARAPAP